MKTGRTRINIISRCVRQGKFNRNLQSSKINFVLLRMLVKFEIKSVLSLPEYNAK